MTYLLKYFNLFCSFLIGGNGFVFEARGWSQTPKLSHKFKDIEPKSISIAYMGIYKGKMLILISKLDSQI